MSCWVKILCAVTSLGSSSPTTISGPATVQDGDTIYINHQPVRLAGIDAPELTEPHGVASKYVLKNIIGNAEVTCTLSGKTYARSVGVCTIGSVELNKAMVTAGYALDCGRYSGGRYRADEPAGVRSRLIQKPYC